ncbi:MAG: M24 family metallopeptidase [Pelosinus sp.]|nr:M24 family metallopeptidase [Pelosinus sp.]
MITVKSDREITYLRNAGKIAAQMLVEIKRAVKPDVTALELDQSAEKYIESGFPASTSSLNEEVVQGVLGLRKLNFGYNVCIDIGIVFGRSMHDDLNCRYLANLVAGQD